MRKKIFSILFALVLVLTMSLVTAVPVAADIIYTVNPGMTTPEINNVIATAGTGVVVQFEDGTYTLTETLVVGVAGRTLEGNMASPQSVIIDGGGDLFVPAVHITAAGVTLEGFTIRNFQADASHDFGAVFVNQGDGATIQDNTVLNITTADPPNPFGIGIDVAANNVDVIGNTVYDVGSIGIRVVKATYQPGEATTGILVENNEVYHTGNTGVVFAGRVVDSTIRGNTLYDSSNPTPYNLLICWGLDMTLPPSGITIEGNTIYGGYGNVVLAGAENIAISGNTITGAVPYSVTGAKGKNIYILDDYLFGSNTLSTNITITNNDITNAEGYGVRIKYTGDVPDDGALMASTTAINYNNISGNTEFGVENNIATDVDATSNWWGATDGPSQSPGSGDKVSDYVLFDPWLLSAPSWVKMTAQGQAATPPTVATSEASDVAFTLATLNGNLTDMGTADSVDVSFVYGVTSIDTPSGDKGGYDSETSPVSKGGIDTLIASPTGLTAGQTYYFRAKAQGNDVADPVYGSEVSFTTAAITTLDATDIGAYTATLNGRLDIGSATSVDVDFEWGETTAYGSTAPATPIIMTESGDFSADLTDLILGATYHFQALGEVDSDIGEGGDKQFTTAPVIGISVSPTSIDFGDIIAGHSSATKTVTVTNKGDADQIFTAELIDEDPAGFYSLNLKIDDGTVLSWESVTVLPSGFVVPGLVLSIPIATPVGPKTATLVFWAEAAPY